MGLAYADATIPRVAGRVPRALRAGSALGLTSVAFTVVAMCLTRATQNGKITLPYFVLAVAIALVGFSMTVYGAFRRRPRGWVPFFLIGFLGNGAILAITIAFVCWLVLVGVPA